jgi:hypothetical protein
MHYETVTKRPQVGTSGARMPLPEDGEPDYARRPGESPKAFASFTAYRDLPAGTRSVAKAAEVLGKSVNTLHRWSRADDWLTGCPLGTANRTRSAA